MTRYASKDVAFLLIDGLSVLGDTTTLSDGEQEALVEDTTPFGVEWDRWESAQVNRFDFEQGGIFDDDSGATNEAFAGNEGVSRVVCFGVEGNTAGQRLKAFEGLIQVNYNRQASKGTLHKAMAKYASEGAWEEGYIVSALGTNSGATGDTESSYIDIGAACDLGGAVYLQVTSLTLGGYTNLGVNIVHSADHVAWSTLKSFTALTDVGAERIVVAAAVNSIYQYVAMEWAFSGSGSGPAFTGMVGVYPIT